MQYAFLFRLLYNSTALLIPSLLLFYVLPLNHFFCCVHLFFSHLSLFSSKKKSTKVQCTLHVNQNNIFNQFVKFSLGDSRFCVWDINKFLYIRFLFGCSSANYSVVFSADRSNLLVEKLKLGGDISSIELFMSTFLFFGAVLLNCCKTCNNKYVLST